MTNQSNLIVHEFHLRPMFDARYHVSAPEGEMRMQPQWHCSTHLGVILGMPK